MITQLIEFDVKKDSHIKITAKEGDVNSRYLEFRLLDNSLPFSLVGRTVRCYMVKPDKRIVFNDLHILDAEDGRCVLKLTLQSLIVSGMAKLELIIYEASKKLSVIPIKMDIIKSLNSNELLESLNEFGALNNALWKIDTFTETMNSKATKEELKKVREDLDTKANETDLIVERNRINNLASLSEGSTTGDAELIDSRVGIFGQTHENLGDAIRKQLTFLLKYGIVEYREVDLSNATKGYISGNGSYNSDSALHTEEITLYKNETIVLYGYGYLTNISMITRVTSSGYFRLVVCTDSSFNCFEYTADREMKIVLSFMNNKAGAIIIKKNELMKNNVNGNVINLVSYTANVTNDCYIHKDGHISQNTSSSHVMSEVISLNPGEVLYAEVEGVADAVSIFSQKINGSTYKPLVIASDSNKFYRYEATEAINIIISAHDKWDKKYYIYDNSKRLIEKFNKLLTSMNFKKHDVNVTNDCYIHKDGYQQLGTKSYHVQTSIISLKPGEYLFVECDAVKNVVSVITEVNNGKYIPLKIADGSTAYNYYATKNIDIVISARKSWNKIYYTYQMDSPIDITPSFSIFEKFGIVGDSYASGEIALDGYVDYYNISWGQILARMSGNKCINFSRGGLSTRTWLTDRNGLSLLNSTEPQQLYILALGINDYYHLGESYLGTVEGITSKTDTFYGNYAKIIESIQTKAPNAKIIISTIASNATLPALFNNAILNIAKHYNIPCIRQDKDDFFNNSYYTNNMVNGHPLAMVYSAMAKNLRRMIEQCMYDNPAYFRNYIG